MEMSVGFCDGPHGPAGAVRYSGIMSVPAKVICVQAILDIKKRNIAS